ncbi:hypothetical protein ABZ069_31820 [Streptomyces microflavus]|uniref:hypothetical protein n=1 Tax=Streptomyces microflavus TaxID=1919 RepID=UPI0033ABAA10
MTGQTLTADIRDILIALADQLAAGPHYRIITEAQRLDLILDEVTRQHGHSLAALNLDREVRIIAPAIQWELTQGEYSLILRAAAGGAG